MAKKDYEQILRYVEEVVKINSNIWGPAFNRVVLLIHFKKYEEALIEVDKLIEKFGDKYEPYEQKADINDMNKKEEASVYYEKA
jgi:tetratricopeptide (TPR) repeat protein